MHEARERSRAFFYYSHWAMLAGEKEIAVELETSYAAIMKTKSFALKTDLPNLLAGLLLATLGASAADTPPLPPGAPGRALPTPSVVPAAPAAADNAAMLDWIFRPQCAGCSKPATTLCETCAASLVELGAACPRCA